MSHSNICAQQSKRFSNSLERNIRLIFKQLKLWKNFCPGTYEAKARGVTRGMRIADIRKVCPDAVILPSDYETYSLLSKRFFAIVRRYTPDVEEYSIDECFADLTGLRRPLRMSYHQIAERIKHDL